jgi:ABC-type phosphate/phosphonate transport system substrate-binding protein
LQNKRFAFTSKGSTSGYWYPLAILKQHKIEPKLKLNRWKYHGFVEKTMPSMTVSVRFEILSKKQNNETKAGADHDQLHARQPSKQLGYLAF